MEVKAVYKYARISAKKMRDIAQEIQGLSVWGTKLNSHIWMVLLNAFLNDGLESTVLKF